MKKFKLFACLSLVCFCVVFVSNNVMAKVLWAYYAEWGDPDYPQLNYTTQFVFSHLMTSGDIEVTFTYYDHDGNILPEATAVKTISPGQIRVFNSRDHLRNVSPTFSGDGLVRIEYDGTKQMDVQCFYWNFGNQNLPGHQQTISGAKMNIQDTTNGLIWVPGFWHYEVNPGQGNPCKDIYVTHIHLSNASDYPIMLDVVYHLSDNSTVPYSEEGPVLIPAHGTHSFMTNEVFGDSNDTKIENVSGWIEIKQIQADKKYPKTARLVFIIGGEEIHFSPSCEIAQMAWTTYNAFYPKLLRETNTEHKKFEDTKKLKK